MNFKLVGYFADIQITLFKRIQIKAPHPYIFVYSVVLFRYYYET